MTGKSDDLVERLRKTLACIEPGPFGGDNLAIFLASHSETGDEDEERCDTGTWEQQAIDKADVVMDAIHAHYAAEVSRLTARLATIQAETIDRCRAAYEAHDRAGRDWVNGSLYDVLNREAAARVARAFQERSP